MAIFCGAIPSHAPGHQVPRGGAMVETTPPFQSTFPLEDPLGQGPSLGSGQA